MHSIRRGWHWLVCLFVLTTVGVVPARSQTRDGAKQAAIRLDEVDADFWLQGEYAGRVPDERGTLRMHGLQVVALGDGQFLAVEYVGGLPGTGWDRRQKSRYRGQRTGQGVLLRGEQASILVDGRSARFFDPQGRWQGQMQKVARRSATLAAATPPRARVLFDGTDTGAFKNGQIDDEGLLQVGTELVPRFRDFTLHVEFRLPYMPRARGQGRANSGVYLQSRYEVQILDSFGLEGEANECGGLYRYQRPAVNVCLPPLAWQTYDITFRSPRFDRTGRKVQNAQLTVQHNGVLIHDHFNIERKTGAGRRESPELLPIKLQDHGNPVRFRNIWVIDHQAAATPSWEAPPCNCQPLAGPVRLASGQHYALACLLPGCSTPVLTGGSRTD
jgi:hypothetical protein